MKKPRKTPTQEQKDIMKELGYTEAQMDAFWKENVGTNAVVTNLAKNGFSWRDMTACILRDLPYQKERDMEYRAEKEKQERLKKEAEEKARKEKEYYKEHFEEIIVQKIDNKEPLPEKELQTLVWQYDIDTQTGENRRWTRTNTTIVKLLDRFFSIEWEEGLTECQENEFFEQPIEVQKRTYEKTITVTE